MAGLRQYELEKDGLDIYEIQNSFENNNIDYQFLNNQLNTNSMYEAETDGNYQNFEENETQNSTQKNIVINDEIENDAENSICKNTEVDRLKYKDPHSLIQKQYKRLIQREGFLKISLIVSCQENNSIIHQIKEEQKSNEMLQLNYEKLNSQVTLCNEEMGHIQQVVLNAGEIDEQLKQFVNSLKQKSKSLQEDSQEMLKKSLILKEKIENEIETKNVHLDHLGRKLDNLRKSVNNMENDSLNNENSLLQQEIIQRRDNLNALKNHMENISIKPLNRNILKEELHIKREKIIELQNLINTPTGKADLIANLECTKQRIEILEQNNAIEENKYQDCVLRNKELEKEIAANNLAFSDKEVKLTELEQENKEKEKQIVKTSVQYASEINIIKCNTDSIDEEIFRIKKDNKIKLENLKLFKGQYAEKNSEKINLILKKSLLESDINAKKMDLELLDEKISKKQLKIKNVGTELEQISDNPILTNLKKKSDSLVGSRVLISETYKSVEKEYMKIQESFEDISKKIEHLKTSVQQENVFDFNKASKTTVDVPAKSILKRKIELKTTSVSPKKVQFANLSTSESSLEDVPNLDRIFENFKKLKEHSATSKQIPKTKRLVFE